MKLEHMAAAQPRVEQPRKVLVYGLGRSGGAVASLLRNQGHEVLIFDERPQPDEVRALEALGCTWTSEPMAEDADLCIAAPGVSWEHPQLQALRERGLETIGEVEWVYRTVDADIVGITGTAGKGTVTRWISDTLSAAGVDAPAGGNIDPPLAAVAKSGATLVAELSSFQLERCPTLRPRVAVALNLHVDHLDRHGSVESYHAAKRNLIRNLTAGDTFVYNADDPKLRGWAEACGAQTLGFSLEERAGGLAAGYLDDATGMLMLHGTPLLHRDELVIKGQPYLANALAVALACAARGLDAEAIRRGLRAFRGMPGRYSLVKRIGKVQFIEDSIATRTLSVRAALEATPAPIVWIAGGVDKGASFAELRELIKEKVTLFIAVGASGASFAGEVAPLTETLLLEDEDGPAALRRACRLGLEHLARRPGGRGSVLLAPLAASFDQFRDYKDRAEAYRRAVTELEAVWTPC